MIMIGDKEACLIKSRFLLLSPEINLLVIELRRRKKVCRGKIHTPITFIFYIQESENIQYCLQSLDPTSLLGSYIKGAGINVASAIFLPYVGLISPNLQAFGNLVFNFEHFFMYEKLCDLDFFFKKYFQTLAGAILLNFIYVVL